MSEIGNDQMPPEQSENPVQPETPVEPEMQANVPDPAAPEGNTPSEPEKDAKKEALSWVMCIVCAVVAAMLIRTFLFQFVRVEGTSMIDTLENKEIMFTTMLDYKVGDPERFDVVICHYPDRKENFVKRVVGLPGDTVKMEGGYLFVNGERCEEEYLTHRANYYLQEYTVPEGKYFVLGDNRSNSNDSHIIGPITRDQVVGHVRAVIFPISGWRTVK